MERDVVERVAAAVATREPVNGVRIVGIDGPSGAGKSSLARPLAEALKAPIIEIDDFVSWSDFAGWWPRFDLPWMAQEERFFAADGTRDRADLVIDTAR
ncbi:hypothetical protein [Actinoplanes sp. NPDC026619]|uniref:hypothetical protein n=1 Tax=Actinoplanes sp. NPDC026619 TaxID=3155798 RepID=UPI0033F96529